MLSKDEEKALLARTIEGLPDGYLRDILESERAAIEHAIDLDVAFLGLDGLLATTICVCPPLTVRHKNGKAGFRSGIRLANTCACM